MNTQALRYDYSFCHFIDANNLVVCDKDTSTGQFALAIVNLSQQTAIRSEFELPQHLKAKLPPVKFRPPDQTKFKITTNNVCNDAAGTGMFTGIHSMQPAKNQPQSLASVIRQNERKFYGRHRWRVVAGSCSFESGLCASADEFGEIHLWRLADGKQIKVLKPVGHTLQHIQWEPDESGIIVGTRHLDPAKDRVGYDFNRYGPVTNSFGFQQWDLKNDERSADYLPAIQLNDRNGRQAFKAVYDSDRQDLRLDSPNGSSEYLLNYEREGNPKRQRQLERWGNPTSIAVFNSSQLKQSHLLIGTDRGTLLEFSVDQINGKNRLQLRRQFLAHEARITSLSVSPTGKFLASASIDGTARIWKMSLARQLADVDFYTDGTRVIYLEPGGSAERAGIQVGDSIRKFDNEPYYERIQKIQRGDYSVGDRVPIGLVRGDGTRDEKYLEFDVRLAEAPDVQEPELSLFFSKEDQWIAWNQEGIYNCSPNGDKHVGWHVNQGRDKAADFSRVSQFERKLYQPNVIQEIANRWSSPNLVGRKTEKTYSVLLPNTAENYKEMKPPKITVRSHQSSATVDKGSVKVEFVVERPIRLELLDLWLFNNGKQVNTAIKEGKSTNNAGMTTTEYHAVVPLEPGMNHLVFDAEHEHATSNKPSLKITRRAREPKSALPKLFLLAVGISEYDRPEFNLKFAGKDANDFAAALKQQSKSTFSEVVSKVVIDDQATTAGVKDGLEWLIDQQPGANDVVFVFFSGRAFFSKKDLWYFGGKDFDPDRMRDTAISKSSLTDFLEHELSDVGNVVTFLDTCRLSKNKKEWPQIHHSKGKDIWKRSRRPVFISCYQRQASLEDEKAENGHFTSAVLRSLKTKKFDRKADGFISLQELVSGTRKLLLTETRQQQTPSLTGAQLGAKGFKVAKLPVGK